MLIYNSQKEFMGIDEKDLKILGFSTLASLKAEVTDFADLFVKTPGFIHNFKHVHWIDFITCADSSEDSQAIININNKSFKCKVSIENIFLSDNASSKAYLVYLNGLRELTSKENEGISGDIVARPAPTVAPTFVTPQIVDEFDTPEDDLVETSLVKEDPYETPLEVNFDDEDSSFEPHSEAEEDLKLEIEEDSDEILDVGDLSFDEDEVVEEIESQETTQLVNENFENGYTYDPHVASEELGLPLDLIEEFIQDFIAQAKEFKNDIYVALDEAEFDQVKILSHKLKGVAANLRIEDAFDVLSVVNSSDDINIIRENLDTFYKIIAKLAGEEIIVEKNITPQSEEIISLNAKEELPETVTDVEDDDLYGDLLDVDDSQVPQKINMPELADDEFVNTEVDLESIDTDIENIEDIDLLELDQEIELSESEPVNLEDHLAPDITDEILLEEEEVSLPIEYSKENIANEIGLDLESFNELFEDYLNESNIIISEIKSAVEEGDYKTCRHEALKLQGMSDNMRLNSFVQEFEILTRSTDKEEVTKAIKNIENTISKISRAGD